MKTLNDLVNKYVSQSLWRNLYCRLVDDDIRSAEQQAFIAGYRAAEITDEELEEMYSDMVLNKKES